MLSLSKLGPAGAQYYLATVAAGASPGARLIEPDGFWLGRAASEHLGLDGTVSPAGLRAVFNGCDPASGGLLLDERSRRGRRIAAYDCTFSCPKTVSLLFALGPEEVRPVVRQAHDSAVAAAVSYLERQAARLVGTSAAGRRSVAADGFLAAAFVHRSSRAPDPHLHTHVVVANMVPSLDWGWRALDARRLYAELTTTAALYETHLRHELTRCAEVRFRGLEGRAWADVAGLDPAVAPAFSRRSREIRRALAESRLDERAARMVADVTRPPKDLAVAFEERLAEWRERGYRAGLSAGSLAAAVGRRSLGSSPEGPALEQAVALALSRAAERSFTRSDLVRARCATAQEGRLVHEVERDVDELIANSAAIGRGDGSDIVARARPSRDGTVRYTTRAMLRAEHRLLEAVAARPGRFGFISYEASGRLAALEQVSRLGRAGPGVLAVAPARAAARELEALTGVETVERLEFVPRGTATLLVVNPHGLRIGELERLLDPALAGRVLLFTPPRAFVRDDLLGGVAALAPEQVPLPPGPHDEVAGRLCLGDVRVLLARGTAALAPLAVGEAGEMSSRRHPVVLVSGDVAVRAELRRACAKHPGLTSSAVLDPMRLGRRLGEDRGTMGEPLHVVVVGGAAELRLGQGRLDALARTHVLATPCVTERDAGAAYEAVVGRVAGLVRPSRLVRELGVPSRDPAGRDAWQKRAVLTLARGRGLAEGRDLGRGHGLGLAGTESRGLGHGSDRSLGR